MDDRKLFVTLTHSIFNQRPDIVFSKNVGVPASYWRDLWRKYSELGYKPSDLNDWFRLKTGRKISARTIRRYIIKQELFDRAQLMIRQGEKIVHLRHFIKHQEHLKPYIIVYENKLQCEESEPREGYWQTRQELLEDRIESN